jgi:hypothetical protein
MGSNLRSISDIQDAVAASEAPHQEQREMDMVSLLSAGVGMAIPAHDYIGLTYTDDNVTGVVYKTGGADGTTVATLTLAYSGANLTSVTLS